MPRRQLAAHRLGEQRSANAYPRRVQLLKQLRTTEQGSGWLKQEFDVSRLDVSQQFMVWRAHRLLSERREGPLAPYLLRYSELPDWLHAGVIFLPAERWQPCQGDSNGQDLRWLGAHPNSNWKGRSRSRIVKKLPHLFEGTSGEMPLGCSSRH